MSSPTGKNSNIKRLLNCYRWWFVKSDRWTSEGTLGERFCWHCLQFSFRWLLLYTGFSHISRVNSFSDCTGWIQQFCTRLMTLFRYIKEEVSTPTPHLRLRFFGVQKHKQEVICYKKPPSLGCSLFTVCTSVPSVNYKYIHGDSFKTNSIIISLFICMMRSYSVSVFLSLRG